MSILTVENLSHGFGDRAIFEDVSFRLLKGEHIGLIGANGEGKSTFMNIITGKLQPDEGKVEWSKNVRVGYLDQHTVLKKGMTIEDVLKSAFDFLFEMEKQMNEMFDKMGEASPEEMDKLMEETEALMKSIVKNGPCALKAAKYLVDKGLDMSFKDGLLYEAELNGELGATEDSKEGIKAFFEKRTPVFKGR